MSKEIDCKKWISLYIYFKGDIYEPECDKIILDLVENIVNYAKSNKLFEKYFFIRYSENGPHVRLRFYADQFLFNNLLMSFIEDSINNYKPKELLSYPAPSATQTESNSSIILVDYEPEIERYGGKEAIKIAEEFFFYSSETAIELIKQMDTNDRSSRLGKGLLATLVLIYVFLPERQQASMFFDHYSKGYLSTFGTNEEIKSMWLEAFDKGFDKQSEKLIEFINLIWEALNTGDDISEVLDAYKKNLNTIKEKLKILLDSGNLNKKGYMIENWYDCIRTIVSSYVHMMNNRLGVSIKEESYISHLISKALIVQDVVNRSSDDK